ncbi:MAG: Ig-like domain-containing protein [Clostridiales Family XIII bacterium]|jgi:GH25 family lysozyme M1 (1,4-beta-N-acetylmuramidase)|nr:Ig-like domain-containing protein [Clostridiales Family XIII bacterium]
MININKNIKIISFFVAFFLLTGLVSPYLFYEKNSFAITKAIKLSVKSKKIRSDKTFKITAKLKNPKYKVIFISEDKKIATVKKNTKQPNKSKGQITATIRAKKAGKVNIIAYIKGKKQKKATCKITIYQRIKATKITLSKTTLSLAKGKSSKLSWKMKSKNGKNPNDKVSFSSSKISVATITNKGTVKAKKPGTTIITVKTESKKKDKIKVTVYSIKAKIAKLKLTIGISRTLSYTRYKIPANTILTFSTSNSKIASVSEKGLVTAIKSGTCTITAKAPDGSKAKTTIVVTLNPVIVDLSKWQGEIDFQKAKGAIDFAILRTQDGMSTSVEYMYSSYSSSCKQYGIPFGVYEFSRFENSTTKAKKEAALFYKTATADGRKPSIFFLDIEIKGFTKTSVRTFIKELRRLAKPLYGDRVKVGVYIAHHLYETLNLDLERDTSDPATPDVVWIPRYGKNEGKITSSTEPDHLCDIWQYTSTGKISGVKENVDLNSIIGKSGKKLSGKDWFTFEYLINP